MRYLILSLLLVLAGCVANAATGGPFDKLRMTGGAPDVRAMMREHPLYSTLTQYDRQINALRATLHTPEFQHAGADIDASTLALRNEIDGAARAINTLVAQKADAYAARQDAAVSTLLANANAPAPTSSDVRARLQRAYEDEYARLRSGADSDMAAYEQALRSQQQSAYSAFVDSQQRHVQQAYAARAQELREKESTLLLDLARKHADRRTQLRAKLQTLYLRPEQRHALQAELAALEQSEDRAVAALRATDSRTLAAYRSQVLAQADRDIAETASELESRTAANLAARRDVLAAQRAAAAEHLPLNAPAPRASPGAPKDLRGEVAAMRQRGGDDFRTAASSEVAAYNTAKSDLSQRFSALRDEDSASVKATETQISQLQHDRDALYAQISAQTADAINRERAKCKCTDVTAAVRQDLRRVL